MRSGQLAKGLGVLVGSLLAAAALAQPAAALAPGGQRVAASGTTVYVVWAQISGTDFDVFVRRSADGGATWGASINLSRTPASSSSAPAVAARGDDVYAVWTERTAIGPQIFLAASHDRGVSFGPARSVTPVAALRSDALLAVAGASVHVGWLADGVAAAADLFVRSSADGGATFGPAVNVSASAELTDSPALAADGSRLYAVWRDGSPGPGQLLFRRSTDGGATFGASLDLNAGVALGQPQVATDGNRVSVAWMASVVGGIDVFLRASGDGGASFAPATNLSANAFWSFDPQLAVSGSRVFVAWRDFELGRSETYFRASGDAGATFAPTQNLSGDPLRYSERQQLAVSGDDVYIAWDDYRPDEGLDSEIYLRKSADAGATFASAMHFPAYGASSRGASLAVDGQTVQLAWLDLAPGGDDVFVVGSLDGGASFGRPANVSGTEGPARTARAAVVGSNVYIVWESRREGNYDVFLAVSRDGGASYGPPVNLSESVGDSTAPTVAASGGSVVVAWSEATGGNPDVLLRRSVDAGATFGPAANLSGDLGNSLEPQVVLAGGNVYVLWKNDVPDSVIGVFDVLFRRSVDGGVTFLPAVELADMTGFRVQLGASGSTIYFVYEDKTFGSGDVFFRRSTDSGSTFGGAVNLSANGTMSIDPALTVTSTGVVVVWNDTAPGEWDVLARASQDGGATFGAAVNVSATAGTSFNPTITAAGAAVFVGWVDHTPGNAESYLARSTNGGSSFDAPVNLSANAGASLPPAVAVAGGAVLALWSDTGAGLELDVVLAQSVDGGATFGTPTNLSQTRAPSYPAALVAAGGSVVAVWLDSAFDRSDVVVALSADGGATFAPPLNLTAAIRPALTVVSSASYVFASPDPTGNGGLPDPTVWTQQANGITPVAFPGAGLFVGDPGSSARLLYERALGPLPVSAGVVFRIRARVAPAPDSSPVWDGDALGWRMILDDGARSVELALCRDPIYKQQRLVCTASTAFMLPFHFGWDDDFFHTYEIRRLASGLFLVSVTTGDPNCLICTQRQLVFGGGSSGTAHGAWGSGFGGGGTFLFSDVELDVVTAGGQTVDGAIALVESLGLPKGTETSLHAKLRAADASLRAGDLGAACGQLGALRREVDAQTGKKLTADQAARVRAAADELRDALGCRS